ncbi:MAG: S26 family signal peptidase [Dehalococcoidia bacterium]
MQLRQLWKNHRLTARNAGSRASWAVYLAALLLSIAAVCRLLHLRLNRFVVAGTSMEPSLGAGDRLLVLHAPAPFLRLGPGVMVIARSPGSPELEVVKRIATINTDRGPTTYVLLGDNPPASTDSRHFGPLPATAISGRVLYRYWPDHRRGTIP